MAKEGMQAVSSAMVEAMARDWRAIPSRAGAGLMSGYLIAGGAAPIGERGVLRAPGKYEVFDAVLSAVTLGSEHIINYLSYKQREDLVQDLVSNAATYGGTLKGNEKREFDEKIAKNAAKIRGFDYDKAAEELLSSLNLQDRPDGKKDEEKEEARKNAKNLVRKLLLDATIACVNKPMKDGDAYGNNIMSEMNRVFEDSPNSVQEIGGFLGRRLESEELQAILRGATNAGKVGSRPFKNMSDEQKAQLADAALKMSSDLINPFKSLNGLEISERYAKVCIVNSARLESQEEKDKLGDMLDSIKDLWSLDKNNIGEDDKPASLKRKYLLSPPSLSGLSTAEEAFVGIRAKLCENSSAKQLAKLAHTDPVIARYSIIAAAMEEVGGNREYPERDKLIAALLPQLAEIDPKTLETDRKAITKLCAKAIGKYSHKSFPIFGDNTVTVKPADLDKMGAALKVSLVQFQQAPKQDVVERPTSLPAGMPAPNSPPVVDRSKLTEKTPTLLEPRPPTTPFSGKKEMRPESSKNKKEQPKVVTAASLEKWEQAELMPHGMPAPERQNPAKSIPPAPLAVPISRPRSNAIDADSTQQVGRPSSAPPMPSASSMRAISEVPPASPPPPSELLKKNPVLEANERSRREIEGWRSSYESLGFVGRLGVSTRPKSHKNPSQSVKVWREWYIQNQKALEDKGFAIPEDYKEVHKIASQHNTSAALDLMVSVQQEVRAKRESQIKLTLANIMAGGNVQEHDTPHPPPLRKDIKVDALNKKREEEEGRSGNGGAARR